MKIEHNTNYDLFGFLSTVRLKVAVFWDVTVSIIRAVMEAGSTSETPYFTAQHPRSWGGDVW
jgi:hypothetical protein